MKSNYDTDFYSWTQEQAGLMRAGKLSDLDIENLLEEVESMGRSEKRALECRLKVLLAHLLKWEYQPTHRGVSWQLTIKEQRKAVNRLLGDNPSLTGKLSEVIENAYSDAIDVAVRETGFREDKFPASCPWDFETVMNPAFLPD